LCLEVGHTRIKAALLPECPELEDLKKIETISLRSKPWLKQNIRLLFTQSENNPLMPLLAANPSKISLSIFGSEKNSKYPSGEIDDFPDNLEELLEETVGHGVTIERDTNAWAIGALEYLKLKSQKPAFPCLAITLGTGVGVVLIEDEHTIKTIEFWTMPWPFPRLRLLVEDRLRDPVLALCKKHLDALFEGEEFLDEGMVAYQPAYNRQFNAFIEDISEHLHTLFGCSIRSVFVGGGHSRFIKPSESLILLDPETLQADGVSPDIIQLQGCLRGCYPPFLSTQIYTSE